MAATWSIRGKINALATAKLLRFMTKPGRLAAASLVVAWLTWHRKHWRGPGSKAVQMKLHLPPSSRTRSESEKQAPQNAKDDLQVYVLPESDTEAETAANTVIKKHMPLWHKPDQRQAYTGNSADQPVHQPTVPEAETSTDISKQQRVGNSMLQVLGVDTEWDSHMPVPKHGANRCQVAVLQLSGPNWCMVLQPHMLKGQLPSILVQLLEDPTVLKAGVGIQEDAKRLAADYGISLRGLIDVRLVAQMILPEVVLEVGQSLSGLTRAVLGRELDKSMQRSHWGAKKLTRAQVTYAAQDAWASQALLYALFQQACHSLAPELYTSDSNHKVNSNSVVGKADAGIDVALQYNNQSGWNQQALFHAFVQPFLDNFKLKSVQQRLSAQQAAGQWPFATKQGFSFHRASSPAGFNNNGKRVDKDAESASSGNKKPSRHALRKTILYENCRIQAPDGTVLCTCSSKKIQWYLNRSLGELVCEDPMTLRLHFEPKGRGHSDDQYYVSDKMNQCVVCGVSSHENQQTDPTAKTGTNSPAKQTPYENNKAGTNNAAQLPSGNHQLIANEDSTHAAQANSPGGDFATSMSDVTRQTSEGNHHENSSVKSDKQPGMERTTSRAGRGRTHSETQAYLRHSVVPACYRRCFPTTFKSHLSHDIVLLCSDCAQVCSMKDQKRMAVLGGQLNAPLSEDFDGDYVTKDSSITMHLQDNSRYKHDAMMNSVRNAARALQNTKVQLPAPRREELKKVIADYYDLQPDELGSDLIDQAGALDPRKPAEEWKSHAEKVVETLKTTADFEAFVRGWRAHFLDSMKPRFLPPYWSVDARVQNSSYKPKDVPHK